MTEIWQFDLTRGASRSPRDGACLLDVVSWLKYGKLDDRPPGVCPVFATYGRVLNDLLPDAQRQRLKPFISRLPDTVDRAAEAERAAYLALTAVRVFAATGLNEAATNHPEYAWALRSGVAMLREQETLAEAERAAIMAGDAAMIAEKAAADADDPDAAWAANVAKNATRAAAKAARYVSHSKIAASVPDATIWAAEAAWIAAATASWAEKLSCAREIYEEAISAFNEVLLIGKQAREIPPDRIEHANRSFKLAKGKRL
jgi:hypothetical protein